MEAFFRNDQEVQECLDLFVEKLFTVSLLSGNDADSEFYKGRQAVEKIVQFFKEMADLPEEALLDGIRQLVEQRLPDPRVIENFPNFYELMNDMILAGLPSPSAIPAMKTTLLPNTLNLQSQTLPTATIPQTPSSRIVLNGGFAYTTDSQIPVTLRQQLWNPIASNSQTLKSMDLNSQEFNVQFEEEIQQDSNFKTQQEEPMPQLNSTPTPKECSISISDIQINEIDSTDNKKSSLRFKEVEDEYASMDKLHLTPVVDNFEIDAIELSEDLDGIDKPTSKLRTIIKSALKSASITFEPSRQKEDVTNNILTIEEESAHQKSFELVESINSIEVKPIVKAKVEPIVEPVIQPIVEPVIQPIVESIDPISSTSRRDPFRFSKKVKSEVIKSPTPQQSNSSIKPGLTQLSPKTDTLVQENEQKLSSKARIVRTSQVPKEGERLALVLKSLFPKSVIRWNFVMGKNTFYAQIEKVLVYLQENNSDQEKQHIEKLRIDMKKQGWCLFICQKEDLSFPRRLERGIRLVLR